MKSYSLMDLLAGEIEQDEDGTIRSWKLDGVIIPAIQRDYAQGRDEQKRIRDGFLDALFAALLKGEEIVLDFVYGSIHKIDDKQYFIPLDGQQRLTTLFLIYCFVGERELEGDELRDHRVALGRFSYATRYVSRQFCDKIANGNWACTSTPRKSIEDQPWFYEIYRNDPTVSSMLNMLDAIYERYKRDGKKLIDKLCKLRFYVLLLDEFGLTDALYIKMNARGKQLDPFENFKADLLKWMENENNPAREELEAGTMYQKRSMAYKNAFALKLDKEWINFFWKFQHTEDERDEAANPSFLRFINRYILTCIMIQEENDTDAIMQTERFEYFFKTVEATVFKYSDFSYYRDFFSNMSFYKMFEKVLDAFSNANLAQDLEECATGDGKDLDFTGQKITFKMRLLFAALVFFFERSRLPEKKTQLCALRQWMRVVGNIVQDPDIRDQSVVVSLSKLLFELSVGCDDIYSYLDNLDLQTLEKKSFIDAILKEEQMKSRFIIEDEAWEEQLVIAERHPLFQGNVLFLIEDSPSLDVFRNRRARAFAIFDENGPQAEINTTHEIIRACISEISRLKDLVEFNSEDSDRNWQLLLRRNKGVRAVVRKLCSLSINDAEEYISFIIGKASNIDEQRYRLMHEILYKDICVQNWMQEKGATYLRMRCEKYYICRPGSWYDWMCLTGPRERLINNLLVQYPMFSTDHRINDSSHFWGKTIELIGRDKYNGMQLVFNDGNYLRVGVLRGIVKEKAIDAVQFCSDEKWLAYCDISLPVCENEIEIAEFQRMMMHKVFSEENADSLYNLVLRDN